MNKGKARKADAKCMRKGHQWLPAFGQSHLINFRVCRRCQKIGWLVQPKD